MKCTNCGAALDKGSTFCGYCGTSVTRTTPTSAQQPAFAASGLTATAPALSTVEASEPLSAAWLARFAAIEKAGGPSLPNVKSLSSSERARIAFNVLGLLFGPFYYFAKGMPKRGVVLTGLGLGGVAVVEAMFGSAIASWVIPVIFATRANIDYYKKVVRNDNEWW